MNHQATFAQFDCAVVGASIAGLYTAARLAEHGMKVCVVDRKSRIGEPVRCAEATGNRAELARFVQVDESWISREITGLSAHINNKHSFARDIPQAGVILSRKRFEKALAHRATSSGARIVLNTEVTGFTENKSDYHIRSGSKILLSCRILIGADGAESRIGRWAGITRVLRLKDAFSSVQYRLRSDFCNDGHLHFFIGSRIIPDGYLWVFPGDNDEISVGAGTYGPAGSSPKALTFLDSFLQEQLPDTGREGLISGCVPLALCPKKLHAGRIAVVGDAARQCNPLTAGGIMNALESADLLSASLCRIADPRRALAHYSRKWSGKPRWEQKVFLALKGAVLESSDEELAATLSQSQKVFSPTIDRTRPFSIPFPALLRLGALSTRVVRTGIPSLFR